MIKSSIEIDKNVKLWSLNLNVCAKQKEDLIQQLKKIEFIKKEDHYFNWSK